MGRGLVQAEVWSWDRKQVWSSEYADVGQKFIQVYRKVFRPRQLRRVPSRGEPLLGHGMAMGFGLENTGKAQSPNRAISPMEQLQA